MLDVLLERDELIRGLGHVEAEELSLVRLDASSMMPSLIALPKDFQNLSYLDSAGSAASGRRPPLVVVVALTLLGELANHVQRLAHELLLMVLGSCAAAASGTRSGAGYGVDDALDEGEVLGEGLANSSEMNTRRTYSRRRSLVVVVVEHVVGRALGDE